MEEFKPVNLVDYNDELSIHIYVNYLRKYIASLKEEIDILFASNILMFYFNAMNFRDDFDNYIGYEDLKACEIYETYDDGHTILTLLLKYLNYIKDSESNILIEAINEYSDIIGYLFTKEDVIKYFIDFMNYIAKVNQINCDFANYVLDDSMALKREVKYFNINYKI